MFNICFRSAKIIFQSFYIILVELTKGYFEHYNSFFATLKSMDTAYRDEDLVTYRYFARALV